MGYDPHIAVFIAIGLISGIIAGTFGVGGGILIVPLLVFFAGFSQHMATGTSLAVLLPPVGLGAVIEYYRHGNVDMRAALIIALCLFIGAWASSRVAVHIPDAVLKLTFGVFIILVGIFIVVSSARKLPV
jgi:uncharacterized membrane protein YfcA